MSNRLWVVALVSVMLLGTLGAVVPATAGDGSVRFLSAGPVRLGDGHTAHMRLFVPSVQRSIPVHFIGDGGVVVKSLEVKPPRGGAGGGAFFEASFFLPENPAQPGVGTMSITDGTSNTIVFEGQSNGIIAILIGLRQGRGMGTMQMVDGLGQTVGILPYIEQDNLFR
jgi:hypothetical protein